MITTYGIMTGKDRVEPGVFFGLAEDVPGVQTRQAAHHHIRAQPVKPKLDIRRHSFSQRVITTWNMLPDNLKEEGTGCSSRLAMMHGSSRGGWELTDQDDDREEAQHPTIHCVTKIPIMSHA